MSQLTPRLSTVYGWYIAAAGAMYAAAATVASTLIDTAAHANGEPVFGRLLGGVGQLASLVPGAQEWPRWQLEVGAGPFQMLSLAPAMITVVAAVLVVTQARRVRARRATDLEIERRALIGINARNGRRIR